MSTFIHEREMLTDAELVLLSVKGSSHERLRSST